MVSRGGRKGGRGMRVTARALREPGDSTLKAHDQTKQSSVLVHDYLDHDI